MKCSNRLVLIIILLVSCLVSELLVAKPISSVEAIKAAQTFVSLRYAGIPINGVSATSATNVPSVKIMNVVPYTSNTGKVVGFIANMDRS